MAKREQMTIRIPAAADEFTVAWCNTVLEPHLDGATVVSARAARLSAPGQTADVLGLDLTFAGNTRCPSRLIAKFTASLPATLEYCRGLDLYGREVSFYKSFGDGELPIPRCYYAAFEPDPYRFVLLLEDLSAGESPSWGATLAHVELAIERIAPMHSRYWCDPAILAYDWLIGQGDPQFFGRLAANAAATLPAALQHRLPPLCKVVLETWLSRVNGFLEHVRRRPYSIVHGDFHPKQMFFARATGEGRFAVIDWQLPMVAPAAWDVARMMALGLGTDVRRAHESVLIERYLGLLREGGVRGYDSDQLKADLITGHLINLAIHVNACATDVDLFKKEVADCGADSYEIMFGRLEAIFEDYDVLAAVKRF